MSNREDELRRALESRKKPSQPQEIGKRKKGKFGTRMNWGFWTLIVMFAWFIIDWFIWGPGRIGG